MRIRVPDQWWGTISPPSAPRASVSARCWRWGRMSAGTLWTLARNSGSTTANRAYRTEECGQLSPRQRHAARELHRWHPVASYELLGRHHQYRGPCREPGAGSGCRTCRGIRHGGNGQRAAALDRGDLGDRSEERQALRQRSLSRHYRRRRRADHRRLAVDCPCRKRRHVLPGQYRARRNCASRSSSRHGCSSWPTPRAQAPSAALPALTPYSGRPPRLCVSPTSATATSIRRRERAAACRAGVPTSASGWRTVARYRFHVAPKSGWSPEK
jgi:hypothetical protein